MNKLTIGLFIALLSTMLVCGCSASEADKLFATQNAQKNTAGILDPIDKAERDCISKTADTYEMNKCSQIAQQSWEKDIQKKLAELKKILNQEDYKKL